MAVRADLFTHVVNILRKGAGQEELSEKLQECVVEATRTGKVSKLTLTLTIKPNGDTGVYEIKDSIKQDLPSGEKGVTIMFGTEDGNLSREAPTQEKLDLKDVSGQDKPELKDVYKGA